MLKAYCAEKTALIDKKLLEIMGNDYESTVIYQSMHYSLMAGGKRLRPILLMAAADAVGHSGVDYLQVACGLEMIHTYSLIHDDLPAMDNDDYRRGKLTNHKVYGDGMAILAGDGLLTAAFETMLAQPNVKAETLLKAVSIIAKAAGPDGMVGGQAIDLESEEKILDAAALQDMHRKKTGALFIAALTAGAVLAEANEKQIQDLFRYGDKFGLTFQITDDILDINGIQEEMGKPVGSDLKNHKSTYVSLYGIKGAEKMAAEAAEEALSVLESFGPQADILREFVKYVVTRRN